MKNMKKLIFLFCAMFIAQTAVQAQSNQEEIDLIQSVFGMEKKAMFQTLIDLEGEADVSFWVVYDEYETARKALGKSRINLIKSYADSYDKLTPEKTDELMKAMIKQKSSLDKLVNKYYKKIKKGSGSKAAGQFLQLETYILAAFRVEIMQSIPFIGELGD
jgi:hypothetical protein